ncbi:ATP-binding protein [Marivita geojedonensis]|uniref:ATP-grasp domain-containing protein n=1 Tax=Marivita geojedonensis TaxID=1123756 RepID=A0A1X4NEB2_9RHOB|nr:hypothetical protein [Marivita geojedonensis]OSQ45283.1 hypothetical protein MGEO_18375 [Marivita geojedonensis]
MNEIKILQSRMNIGYKYGLKQYFLHCELHFPIDRQIQSSLPVYLSNCISEIVGSNIQNEPPYWAGNDRENLLQAICYAIKVLQDISRIPTCESGKIVETKSVYKDISGIIYTLALPTYAPKITNFLLAKLLEEVQKEIDVTSRIDSKNEQIINLNRILDDLDKASPKASNPPKLIDVAFKRNIPMIGLPDGVWQFGWAKNSRLFRSTISDDSPAISVSWAKQKANINRLLKMGNVSVPEQRRVQSIQHALDFVEKYGYPVVVKAPNLAKGQGVKPNLNNEFELQDAFQEISKIGKDVLIERHIDGYDVRVEVIKGKFACAWARHPARVTGDGEKTIEQLIEEVNSNPQRTRRGTFGLYKIKIDTEVERFLELQNLSKFSIPRKGQTVKLRRLPNSSAGGTKERVSEEIHQDNIDLCIKAARLLRLDIAGIDFITSNHKKSWKENGAAICEVNATPQMGSIYPESIDMIFESYIDGQGRIPISLILTNIKSHAKIISNEIRSKLANQEIHIIDTLNQISTSPSDLQGKILPSLMDTEVEGVILICDHQDLLRRGLPIDMCDVIFVSEWSGDLTDLYNVLELISPHVREGIFSPKNNHAIRGAMSSNFEILDANQFRERIKDKYLRSALEVLRSASN